MGHYDSSYEHDEDQLRKKEAKQAAKVIQQLREWRANCPITLPDRFEGQLDDLENYLTVRCQVK